MYIYTTPTLSCKIIGIDDWTNVEYVRLAIQGQCTNKIIKEVPISDITIVEQDGLFTGELNIPLTQEETALLKVGVLGLQARIKFQGGAVLATNEVNRRLNDVIDKVVI